MSLSNLTVKITYQGDGSTDTFAIPFDPIVNDSLETKVYLRDESEDVPVETLQEEGALNEYVLDGAVSSGDFDTNVVFNTPPTLNQKVVIYRELPLTQTLNFPQDGYNASALMKALDRIVAMIQQVNEKFTRVPMLPITEQATQLVMPEPVALQFIRFNTAGTNLEAVDVTDVVSDLITSLGGIPAGGILGDILVKQSETDGDVDWTTISYEGYSAKHDEVVDLGTLQETLDYLIGISYTAPLISLTASGSTTIREKGAEVTAVTLTATITKRSNPIGAVRYYKDGVLIETEAAPNAAGGTETYEWTGSFTDYVFFRAQVDDTEVSGNGPTTVSSGVVEFIFVYPYYVGAGAADLTAAEVAALTKRVITEDSSRDETITAGAGEVFYFAYPASYGVLTSILDQNGFETIGDWTLRVENITGLDGTAQSYNIYEFNNAVTADDYTYTFTQ